jgi:signal transduction histidine kinase/CheY-like chemotaxis protein
VRAFANPIRDGLGTVTHVVVAFTDITSEVRAVVEREEVEKRLEVAIHHAPILLFMMDTDGVVTAADGALRPTLVRGNGGMVGRSLFEAYKDHPMVLGNVRRALAGETVSYSVEVRELILDVWLGPLRNAAGELAGAIGVCTDVTEGRRFQTRLIQDDRIRAMGTLAASVAHEINNPLTYVLAGLEAARTEIVNLSLQLESLISSSRDQAAIATSLRRIGKLQEYLDPVLAGTKRIRDITRELRTFTRSDEEQQAVLDLGTVVRSVLKLVRKEIEARARLVEDVGVSPPVLANEARMVQVLTNLLVNAWQALPGADPARHVIGVRTGTHAGHAIIEVWDSGAGVPPQLREKIFEPFTTTKPVGAGSGLGLFVCRNIINSWEGRITVHEAPGGGALFRVVLPATTASTEVLGQGESPDTGNEARARRSRILIIDDDELVAGALASRLDQGMFEVRAVCNARQGLDILLADEDLDLAYCDLMMRDLTGIALHEAVKRKAPRQLRKVVFMTGGAFTAEARAFLEERPNACVEKPFDIAADVARRIGRLS